MALLNYMDMVRKGPWSIIPCITIPARIDSDELMLPQHSLVFISMKDESREAWKATDGKRTRVCDKILPDGVMAHESISSVCQEFWETADKKSQVPTIKW